MAGGCGGSSGTPTAPPISDPSEVITKSVGNLPAVKSLHIKIDVTGKVNTEALSGSSSGGIGLSGNLDLAGTTIEGDVDVAKIATDLKFTLPSPLGTGEVIVVDNNLYYKLTLFGGKFTKSALSDTVPVSIPSPGAVASVDINSQVASLRKSLDDAGAKATLMADEKVNGKDAYHVSILMPIDKINALLAAEGGAATSGMKLDTATFDYWAYKDSVLPAKATISGSAGSLGNVNLVLTLTDYDKPVTINAPAASDISG
jgi:hypothetical protein